MNGHGPPAGDRLEARAVQIDRYGPPEVLRLRPVILDPPPAGEVRLRMIAAAVNRADIEIRSGTWPVERDDPFPYTPGIEVLGEDEDGKRQITMMQRLGGIHGERPGGYADYVTVPATSVAPVPDDVDPYAMAALGLAAVTALEGLRRLDLGPGDRLAILGASGGVGTAAVSLAKALGASVTAVLPRSGKEDHVREAGADAVVLLDREALPARSLDAVLELLGARTFAQSVASLVRGGRLCLVGAVTGPDLGLVAWDLMQDLVLTGYSSENLTGDALRAAVAFLVEELRAGRIRPPAHRRVKLGEAAEAHRLMEKSQVAGRLLLVP